MGRPGPAHVPAGWPRPVPTYSLTVNILGALTVILRGYLCRKHQLEGSGINIPHQNIKIWLPANACHCSSTQPRKATLAEASSLSDSLWRQVNGQWSATGNSSLTVSACFHMLTKWRSWAWFIDTDSEIVYWPMEGTIRGRLWGCEPPWWTLLPGSRPPAWFVCNAKQRSICKD